MPYYNDVPYYYGGTSYANHSSLMTGTGRTPFHTPLTRFSPHLSTISESPLNQLHRFAIRSSPISVRRVRRVIDTKDIDVSSPRILPHNGNRPRNRLQRNRPTIKIRSQALKDNPVLREHNEKHEKSVGELLMEKFFIKDTKLDGDGNQQIRLYHQVSLNHLENPQEQEAVQKQITRRFTRRRSSADLQLSPEQLQQKVAYAEVQAKVLDSLVAEEQAQIENEIRRGTLMRKDTTTRGSIAHSYYTDSDTTQEEKKTARIKKTMNKTKKKKKSAIDNSWLADKIDNRQSSTCNEMSTDSEIEEKSNGPKPQLYKIEACNSTGDFSTIWMNSSSENEKCKSMVEQFRESVKIPIPRTFETENKIDTFPKNVDETEMQIVLPMRKPYVKDSSRNSVYLTVRKPTEKLEEKLEQIEKLNNNENQLNLTNGFVDVKKDDELNSLTNKDTLESNDDVQMINDIKDATLKKIPDKPKKIKSSAKTNIYSALDNTLNLENKDSLKSNDDVQTTNDIKDIKKISDESKKLESSARKNIYSALDNNLDIENKDSPKSNDDVKTTNDIKNITLEKISDKSNKVESSAKKNIYSALDNNLNLESKELKSNDIQTTNDIKDIKESSDESKKLESSSKKNIYSTLDNNLDIENKNLLKSKDDVQITNDVKDITLKKISDKSKPKQLESSAKKNIYSTLDNNLNIEDKNSLKSNDDVQMTNEVKDITLKKIPDKPKKIKSSAKTNIYSALDNNLNLESKDSLKLNDNVQTTNDIKDIKEISDESKNLESSAKKNIYSTLDNNLNIGDKNSLKSNDDVQMTNEVKDITLKKIADKSKPKQLESSAKKNIYSTLDNNLNIGDKNSLKSNDDVQMTNDVKDITIKKISDKFKKMESLTKKNSTLDNNLNTGNKIVSKINSDVRENDINNAPLSKSAEKSMQSSVPTIISTKNDAQNNDAQIKQLPKNIVTNIKKDESGKNDNVITAMKSLDCQKTVSTTEMPGILTTKDSFTSKTDKLMEEEDKLKMSATLREDATKRSVVSSEANDNAGENSANSATCHLPKPSKINTDRNNVIEAPELSLRETAQYLANPPESAEEVLTLPEKKMNKESNLAKAPFFNAPKKTNSVDANKSTLKTGVTQTNDIANLVTKGMTLLKEMNDEVRSTDSNEEMKSITDVTPSKIDLNTETPKNKIEKSNGNISRKLSIEMTNPSKVETEIITTKISEPKESNLLKTDIKKIDNVDIEKDSGDSDLSNLKNNVPKLDAAKSKFKTKTFSKTAANETDKMVSPKIKKDSDTFKITKSNDDKSVLFPQKDRDMPRILKKSIPVDPKKSMNDCLSNNISNVQQSASVDEKTADKISIKKEPTKLLNKITEEPTKLLSKITEKKPVTVDVSYNKSQEKGGQLSKSASTESVDFWSEIKAASSPEEMKSKQESGFSFYETTITKVENIDPTNCMFNDSLAEKKSLITSVKNSDDKKDRTNVEKGVTEFGNSMIEPSNVVVEEEKEKEKTIVEPPKVKNKETAKLVKTTEKNAPKVLLKKKKNLSIAIGAKDSNSIVKKAPLKHDSAISIQPDSTTPDVTTVAASEVSTSLPEVTIPIINIIEECNEDFNSYKIDDENSKTPTNEPSSDLFLTATISKWSNQDNLTNSDDVETPVVSEETSLVGSPNISPSSLKTKHSTKKKKTSTKKTPSTKSEKEVKIRSNESTITSQQNTLIPEKQFSAKTSPNSSPRNTPSQRPLDLIRMFYTTPSALLTATPRDLSKIRRAKIKKRRHQLKTPSVSSDSTGSTTSTATTGSTDGSRSTCVELDDDSEHKNSTRSNDSGFDGSPRILTPSQSSDNQRNSDISERFPSGRITPPATNLPRFKKYAVTDFNFLKVLGKGSFGKVLLAELCGTECLYAVKCLKKDVVLEDDDVECTLIERKVLTLATRHPYLCHLFCTFQTDSHLFFVMEYLNGGDLMFHIQKSGRFPETRARFYAAEIWSGLNFLHKKGIVYRDLKLDNVLLDFEGHIRIADFGMCKLQIFLDRTADTFCGTPDYMAPEIIKGLKYNHAVDWWSYGVLLYEMLTGQSPFSGCDEDELFWSICNERPFIPRYLSQEASDMLICLLEKDSAKRPPSHEIAMHAFFQHLPWDRLERRQLEPPFKPAIDHTLDTKYFDTAFTTERPRLTPVPEQILTSMDQGVFRGFSYTNPNATD
ncbi:AGC-kinase C-terminal domain-containing protein [Camponotus japonicus]